MARFHISKFKVDNADADQITESFRTSDTIAEVQPLEPRGRISVDVSRYSIGPFFTWSGTCHSGMQVKLIEPADVFVVYLPANGLIDINVGRSRHTSGREAGFVGDFSNCEQIQFGEGRVHTGIAINKSALTQHLSQLIDVPVRKKLEFLPTLQNDSVALKRIEDISNLLWSTLLEEEDLQSSRYVESLFSSVGTLLLESLQHSYSAELAEETSGALPRHIKRAIEYMSANTARPLTIGEIATEAGVSIRRLQIGFQNFKGTTPLEYLRRIRLEGVRKALIDNADRTPIVDIARQWGFQHMGRFAGIYHEAFGELPSQTGK